MTLKRMREVCRRSTTATWPRPEYLATFNPRTVAALLDVAENANALVKLLYVDRSGRPSEWRNLLDALDALEAIDE